MFEILPVVSAAAALLGVLVLVFAVRQFWKARIVGGALSLCVSLLSIAVAALVGAVLVGTQGYRALTKEEVAVTVTTEPTAPQRFRATLVFADGQVSEFDLAGDQFTVDARILKWHAWANVLGLHTAYELDRVSGRYRMIEDERSKERTLFSLVRDRPMDVFELRQKFPRLAPLVDAEYGSATFVPADQVATYEVRVSTTGLLARLVDDSRNLDRLSLR